MFGQFLISAVVPLCAGVALGVCLSNARTIYSWINENGRVLIDSLSSEEKDSWFDMPAGKTEPAPTNQPVKRRHDEGMRYGPANMPWLTHKHNSKGHVCNTVRNTEIPLESYDIVYNIDRDEYDPN